MKLYQPERVVIRGDILLGDEARVVAVISPPDVESSARRAEEQGADLIEVRLDHDPEPSAASARSAIATAREASGLPVIATLRLGNELGGWHRADRERLPIFAAAAEEADALDVELRALAIRREVVKLCKDLGCLSIVSFHELARTPPVEHMQMLAAEAVETLGGDVFKLCPTAHGPIDVARLMSFVREFRDKYETAQIVGMALGAEGSASRLMGPVFGSCMTYGYVEGDTPAAPGQLSIRELRAAYDASE